MLSRQVTLKDLAIKHLGWTNPRFVTGLEPESIAKLGQDLKTRGQQIPLIIQRVYAELGVHDPEKVVNLVLDGQRRFLGFKVTKFDGPIEVVDHSNEILDLTPEVSARLLLDAMSIGMNRESLSSMELLASAKLLQAQNHSVTAIGKAIGKDGSWVSRMLAADKAATPPILKKWQDGDLPDEIFKELAAIKPDEQKPHMDAYTDMRKAGDKGTARQLVLEAGAQARAEKAPSAKGGPRGKKAKKAAAEKAAKKAERGESKPTSKAMLEEFAKLGVGRAVMDPYTKGLIDGVRYALGEIETKEFQRSFHRFVARIENTPFKSQEKRTNGGHKKKGN